MCWWMMMWIVTQATWQEKKVLVSGTKSTNYWLLVQMLYHWATRQSWFTKINSLFCTITYVSFVMVLHVDVHPLNFVFDSSKINGSSFNVKDQQIDANKLQGYLLSSGFFGSYYRKYDFMYFHASILFDNIYFCWILPAHKQILAKMWPGLFLFEPGKEMGKVELEIRHHIIFSYYPETKITKYDKLCPILHEPGWIKVNCHY